TLYFALTGRIPFRGHNTVETIAMHLQKEPEPLQSLRPEVPAEVAAVVHRLMAKRPEQRFQTPAELVEALGAALRFGWGTSVRRGVATPAPGKVVPPERPQQGDPDAGVTVEEVEGSPRSAAPSSPSVREGAARKETVRESVLPLWRAWY